MNNRFYFDGDWYTREELDIALKKKGLVVSDVSLPPEVKEEKMNELQREQMAISKQESLGNLRASCYGLTLNRLQLTKQEDKIKDLPYVLAQADLLLKFISNGTVPVVSEATGRVLRPAFGPRDDDHVT